MRLRKPHPASLDEVVISRVGDDAVVEFREPGFAVTHLSLGRRLRAMSDAEILELFNRSLRDQAETASAGDYAALEIPPGIPQLEYFEAGAQWVPRGSVVRCVIDDSGPAGEAIVHVDDVELSLAEFGRMLCTFSGWGMRICFVPEECLDEPPRVDVGEPEDDD